MAKPQPRGTRTAAMITELPTDEQMRRWRESGEFICMCPEPLPYSWGECRYCRKLIWEGRERWRSSQAT
jgi:hypothetical protein